MKQEQKALIAYQMVRTCGEVEHVVKVECSIQASIVFTTTAHTVIVVLIIYTNTRVVII